MITKNFNNKITFEIEKSKKICSVYFHRSLKIIVDPNSDKNPSPPLFNTFNAYNINDYKDKLPEKWKNKSGIFIPLFQNEAIKFEFETNDEDFSFAVKIGKDNKNLINGKEFDIKLHKDQDYLVIPKQQLFEGIYSDE
eukprot:EC825226.1.p1 GENE.EC825226.1~~EC825226.1.p1  ORF type:complete len:138 (+),score=46.49 EC825226.1:43-456(+)